MIKNLALNVNYCFIPVTGENTKWDLKNVENFNIQDEFIYADTGRLSPIGIGQGTVFLRFLRYYLELKFPKLVDENILGQRKLTTIIQAYFAANTPPEFWFMIAPIFDGFELGDIQGNLVSRSSRFLRIGDGEAIFLSTGFPEAEIKNEMPRIWHDVTIDFSHPEIAEVREQARHMLETTFKLEDISPEITDIETAIKTHQTLYYSTIFNFLKPGIVVFRMSEPEEYPFRAQLYDLYSDMLQEFNNSGINSPEIKNFLEYSRKFFRKGNQ
jgi:hypothetical protein